MSTKGMEPSGLVSSTVNLMALSMLFMCCKKFLCSVNCMTNVSFINLYQILGGFCDVLSAFSMKISVYKLATVGLSGVPCLYPQPVHNTYLGTGSRCCGGRTPQVL